jgi:hypothetical protein
MKNKYIRFLFIAIFLMITVNNANAQKRGNQWLFGGSAGLDFNSGSPVPILTSDMGAPEGSASIADPTTGALLFYTNGGYVWDASNNYMPNGSTLGGSASAAQTVIVPKPGSNTLYYIFTLPDQAGIFHDGNGGLDFSIVDMSLHGGLGDVTVKDSLLFKYATEKCAVTLACDHTDYWVVAHQWNSNAFYAYRISANGISAPVISHTGIIIDSTANGQNSEAIGYMRISNDGKKIAFNCEYGLNTMQLSDFDNATGIVSNYAIDTNFQRGHVSGPYGLCFSPDNSKLYVAYNDFSGNGIGQYNVLTGNDSAIIASRVSIVEESVYGIFAMQQGPDGKLYIARGSAQGSGNADSLAVIAYPDSAGAACDYILNGVSLGGTTHQCLLGLPDIILNYTLTPISDSGAITPQSSTICSGQNVLLTASGGTSYSWAPALGLNPAIGDSVVASPTVSTTYTVTGINANRCYFSDSSVVTVISIPPTPTITHRGDTLISSAASGNQWLLNDTLIPGAMGQKYVITETGWYQVTVENAPGHCGATSDSIFVEDVTGLNLISGVTNEFSLYPNPFGGKLYLKINSSIQNINTWSLKLTDVLGQTIYDKQSLDYDNALDLSALSQGIYYVTVKNEISSATISVVKR